MMGLTKRQADLLAFLKQFSDENDGMAPTFDEMAAAIGQKSKSRIFVLLDALVERGLIRRMPGRKRAIEVIAQRPAADFLNSLDSETWLAISSEALRRRSTAEAVMIGWLNEKAAST